ncbi:transcription factor AP-4-like protein [Camelus ferus]|nr:transcription factor AP-4-like protein [Camelus ferus]
MQPPLLPWIRHLEAGFQEKRDRFLQADVNFEVLLAKPHAFSAACLGIPSTPSPDLQPGPAAPWHEGLDNGETGDHPSKFLALQPLLLWSLYQTDVNPQCAGRSSAAARNEMAPQSCGHVLYRPGQARRGLSLANIPLTPETQRDQERRIRREIANSNERRRMQSINAGFQSLKTLIPHTDGEKLSKVGEGQEDLLEEVAAILQQTAEYIFSLEQEKTRLLQQNTQLKRFIQELSGSSPKRRRAEDKDEGIGSPDIWEDEKAEDLRREMIELRQQLDKERSVRMMLEEQVRSLEAHMYPEKLKLLPTPAPTPHPTVIVPAPAPPPSHHINVVTMGPSSVINSVSTSRQNLDTIVQAIQHIEGTQERQEQEEEQRRAVIVKPVRSCPEAHASDTASDSEASDSDAMDQSREEPAGNGGLP